MSRVEQAVLMQRDGEVYRLRLVDVPEVEVEGGSLEHALGLLHEHIAFDDVGDVGFTVVGTF